MPIIRRMVASLPRLPLRTNFRWTFAGNVVNAASQMGMLAVLARLGNPAMVGQFVLGLAVAAPVMALTMLQLRNIQVTDARGEYRFEDYLGTRVAWSIVGLAIIAACAWLGGFEAQTAWVVLLIGLTKCIDSVSDIVRGLFQRHERMDYSGISLMIRGPGALGAMALVMWLTGRLVPAVAAMAGVWFVSFLLYDMVLARRVLACGVGECGTGFQPVAVTGCKPAPQRFRLRFAWNIILPLTWIALPLGIVTFLTSLQTNIPRYILEGYSGEEALGYFGALVYPMVAGMLVIGAMGQSASPRLAQLYLQDISAFRALLRKLLLLAMVLGIALVAGTAIVGRPVLALLYGADYSQYHQEFIVVALAAAIELVSSSWGYGLTAARVFRTQVVLALVSCLAATIAAFVLVPKWGVMGAAVTVLATSVVRCSVVALAIRLTIRRGLRLSRNSSGAE